MGVSTDKDKEEVEKGGRIKMCKAWDDNMETSRRLGRAEGIERGKTEILIRLVQENKLTIREASLMLGIGEEKMLEYMEESE